MADIQALNAIGLSRTDYRGLPSTLCQGCGHNAVSNQIIQAMYEMNIQPEKIVKFSGIGCSSKSPAYFLGRSFAFNGVHGRMPSLATGALFADTSLYGMGVSGDGDTASIGMGQFKHVIRRNLPMVYIVENNGVYGLTKGQFSATAEKGLTLKHEGTNLFLPVDICLEALASNATFVARGFAGDPKQLKELLKAAIKHRGTAVLDIISPCVTFNNKDDTIHSYAFGKEREVRLHDLIFVPARDQLTIEDFEEGTVRDVELYDGSVITLRKLERDYDPTSRSEAFRILEEARERRELITGLIYVEPDAPSIFDLYELPEKPLNRMTEGELRPASQTLNQVHSWLFSNL
ncbi:2-oxoacid:ferredoxin oxidoreductase subunit beta [Anaerolinea thermophila]|uniref:2-oxoglutarate ferredoxin oxidoreductase beta subunit n=1 Tax=Anaerolinea thermophila (strain DSM 14523 / JCM 11388 / NBRC 100420 / UNI-1) TaxID=926569 RepID=E8N5X6_ANATU|nr:2-oxoacid:ferredoxin oxidoreductase subunit beta [Anaerolinea thermophila]BAJ63840.1 putative 2-oxoglutarate ferredoxin oxidoreductase beta subunit [Anaerolinea thermophila UNI-1]